jgi:ABC-type proline/glycine betaine transport system permease subunit
MAMSYIDEADNIIKELKDHVCVLFWTSVASILLSITTALVVFIVR